MLGITSFVGAQVCSQNQACCSAMLHALHEQMERREFLPHVCRFKYQCIYKIKGTWRSDVTPLSAEFASGVNSSSAIFGRLYANFMLLLQPMYRSHNYSNWTVCTNLCLNFVCISIYLAKKWSGKSDLNCSVPRTLLRGSSGFLSSDLDQLCSPAAKQTSMPSEESSTALWRVLSTCPAKIQQQLAFSCRLLITFLFSLHL